MMKAFIRDVQTIALVGHVFMHKRDGGGLVIVGARMHALNAQSFVIGQKLDFREVGFFL